MAALLGQQLRVLDCKLKLEALPEAIEDRQRRQGHEGRRWRERRRAYGVGTLSVLGRGVEVIQTIGPA